jgi:pilin isopeptide linkage protein
MPLEYDQEDIGKTYTYRVSEDPGAGSHGSLPNHTYDATAYTVTVAVGYDEETGELTTAVATDVDGQQHTPEDERLAFENAYAATAEVPLSGTKELTGRELEAGEFAFRLYEVGQEGSTLIQTVYNGANGAFDFMPLEYDQEDIGKTYTYRVSEDPGAGSHGSLPNHTYDATAYTVTVAVGYDEETGELTTAVATDVDGQQHTPEDERLAFENAYAAATSVALSGTKALTGRVIEDGNFSFKLTDVTDSAHLVDIETVPNVGNAFGFAALGYDEGDIGATYTYQVRELNGGVGGYTYDAAVYTVAVTVGYDSATGLLTTRIETYKDGTQADNVLAFSNAYEAVGGYTPAGTKALKGRSLVDGMFRFEVRDEEGALAASGVSDASGAIDFTEIVYQKNAIRDDTGAHTYTISEITGNDQGIDDAGVVYSVQTFGLTVVVTDNGDGTLSAEAEYPDGAAAFENGIEKVIVEGRKIWSDESDLYDERRQRDGYLLATARRLTTGRSAKRN